MINKNFFVTLFAIGKRVREALCRANETVPDTVDNPFKESPDTPRELASENKVCEQGMFLGLLCGKMKALDEKVRDLEERLRQPTTTINVNAPMFDIHHNDHVKASMQ